MQNQSTPERPDYQDRVARAMEADMQQAQVLNQALDRIYAARPDIGTMRRVAVQKPRFVEGSVSMGGTHVRLVDGDGKGHMLTAQEALEAVRRREMRRAG